MNPVSEISPSCLDTYPHLRHTGTVPTHEEHSSIVASQQTLEASRRSLQAELSQLRERLEHAQHELTVIEAEISLHASITSSIRRLPADVLGVIFEYAIPATLIRLSDVTSVAPWTLLLVCHHWSDVCLQHSSLWSRVYIDTDACVLERPLRDPEVVVTMQQVVPGDQNWRTTQTPSLEDIVRAAELLELQLRRSRDVDLFITIQSLPNTTHAQPFLRIILPHLHRAAYLRAPYHVLATTPLSKPLDRLTHLIVDYSSLHFFQNDLAFQPIVSNSREPGALEQEVSVMKHLHSGPKLTRIEAISLQGPQPACPLPSPLSHKHRITRLVIGNTAAQRIFEYLHPMLPELTNLMELEMMQPAETWHGLHHISLDQARTHLPMLRKLLVSDASCVQRIVHSIVAPGLEQLTHSGSLSSSRTTLGDFLSASASNLQVLQLETNNRDNILCDFIIANAVHWKSLHSFGIIFPEEEAEDYQACNLVSLLVRPSINTEDLPSDPFPLLSHLTLRGMVLPPTLVIDMLESRRRRDSHLDGVQLLASCTLVGVDHPRRFHDAQTLSEIRFMHVSTTIFYAERMNNSWMSEDTLWPHRDDPPPPASWMHNPHLPWRRGLETDAKQKARLDLLQEGGLEMWTRRAGELEMYERRARFKDLQDCNLPW